MAHMLIVSLGGTVCVRCVPGEGETLTGVGAV